jgi:hypothetical protein
MVVTAYSPRDFSISLITRDIQSKLSSARSMSLRDMTAVISSVYE